MPKLAAVLYRNYLKRVFDLAAGLFLCLLFLPVMLAVALLLRIYQGKHVLFKHTRPGLYGRPFTLLKFRTMTDARDGTGELLPDELRITAIGTFVRRWSLDELPQLFNVLAGDISLIGPRPLLMEYLPLYNREQQLRHNVRPGITGWAQVNGRNATTWKKRFAYDVWYVQHLSFALDIRILLRTIRLVLSGEGITSDGETPMPRFTGTPE